MKPIRWVKDSRGILMATVEGVRISHEFGEDGDVLSHVSSEGKITSMIIDPANKQQLYCAAYALADLVATLRGME
jgi:hypothetical protein